MAEEATGDVIGRLMIAAVVRPGDTLVVGTRGPLTMADAAELRGQIEEHLPGVRAAVIEAEQLLVYRKGAGPDGCICPHHDVTPYPGPPAVERHLLRGVSDPNCPAHGEETHRWTPLPTGPAARPDRS